MYQNDSNAEQSTKIRSQWSEMRRTKLGHVSGGERNEVVTGIHAWPALSYLPLVDSDGARR